MATRDAAATKRRILAAALKEFAAKGIAGARVDAIAARARTNKRMIYYYFGSKEGLFREILHQRLAAKQDEPGAEGYGDRLAERLGRTVELRDYIRLLMWEALGSGKQPVINADERAALYADLRERVADAQAAGDLPADLDPAQHVLTELSLMLFPAAFPQITELVTGQRADDPAFLADRQAYVRQLAEHLAGRTVPWP